MKKNNIKEIILGAVTIIVIGASAYFLSFALGKWSNKVDKVIGTESASIQREKFKENKSYVEGMINDLNKYKREYEKALEDEKEGVLNYIDSEFANFDETLIENQTLYNFLMDVRNDNLNQLK